MLTEIITGFTREPAIIMEWILVFVFLETGLMSFFKYVNAGKDKKSRYDVGFAVLFTIFSGKGILALLGDFYAESTSISKNLLFIGEIIQAAGYLAFVVVIEQKERFFAKRLFTVCTVVVTAAMISVVFADPVLSSILSLACSMIFSIFFVLFYARMTRKSTLENISRRAEARSFVWFIGIGIGHILSTSIVSQLLDPAYRLVGDAIMLVSIPGIYIFIARMPPLIEIDWYSKLESVFIMHSSGVCIYNYYFNKPSVEMHQNLITGAITSIRVLLEQITKQSGISVIKKDQNTTIIYPGKQVFGVLICKEDIEAGRFLAKKIVDRVESIFSPLFDKWEGDLAVFEPVDQMRAEIFRDTRRKAAV